MSANRLKLNAVRWSCCRLVWDTTLPYCMENSGPSLRLDDETVVPSDHVRVLGVFFSSDLSLDKHVTTVSLAFYWLRQLRRVRRSVDADSTETLVHAFISSRADYCNAVFNGAPRYVMGTYNASWMRRPASSPTPNVLDIWYICRHSQVWPRSVNADPRPTPLAQSSWTRGVQDDYHGPSVSRHRLIIRWYRRSTLGRRAFSIGGPTVWNSLPVKLREPAVSNGVFRRTLKTILFARY